MANTTADRDLRKEELPVVQVPSKLNLPRIQKVSLVRFSLYTLQPSIEVEMSDGVFCLAGANGLGKSTFLAAINFAITGIVPDPKREFKSVKEYSQYGQSFSDDFFSGRIAEEDRDFATVSIEMQIANHRYKISRGAFEPDQLRDFTLEDLTSGELIFPTSLDNQNDPGTERQQRFADNLTKDVGLNTFDQFIFLQHFVFTFDESRHLLLWDQRVLTQALYISIGADYSKAQHADKLRREMERADSRARNRNYAASNVRSRIDALREALNPKDQDEGEQDQLVELQRTHKQLNDEVTRYMDEVESKRNQLADADLKWIEASSQLSAAQEEYSKEFSKRVQSRPRVELHPLVAASLSDKSCSLCGTSGESIVSGIKQKINQGCCPLCESHLPKPTHRNESLEALREIDSNITRAKQLLTTALKTRDRITAQLRVAEDRLYAKSAELASFEEENQAALLRTSSNSGSGLEAALQKLQEEMTELIRQKREEYAKRDEKRKELLKLQGELERRYKEVEVQFVPLFQDLASLFLGIDLEVRMDANTSTASPGLSLTLEMRGQSRRETYQLSESQRFFLDIALRMALTQFMSHGNGKGCLLIDTPEGSLDIAYESRAGEMFAKFAESGHNIIMTANINSSQLLLRLASLCGPERMTLYRMTSWTELSEVQLLGEQLFNEAYTRIQNALSGALPSESLRVQ